MSVPVLDLIPWRPELVLVITVLCGLLARSVRRPSCYLVVLAGLALATGLAATTLGAEASLPLGAHLVVDEAAQLVRLALCVAALLILLALPASARPASPFLVLSALGVIMLAEAATVGALLLATATSVLGGSLAAHAASPRSGWPSVRRWHLAASLGFALVFVGLVFWSGLTGSLEFERSLAGLVTRPSLSPLAVPAVLSLLLSGLALSLLLEPGRFARDEPGASTPPALTAWLTAAPPLGLVVVLPRLLLSGAGLPAFAPLGATLTAAAAVLVLGGFAAAAVQRDLVRRLAWAAAGQVGLALLGFGFLTRSGGAEAAMGQLLAFAIAQLGAVLLAGQLPGGRHGRRGDLAALLLTGLLLSLAAVPPLAGWRPRLGLFTALLADDRYLLAAVVALGTILGLMVYLLPLVRIWRRPAPETAEDVGHERPPAAVVLLLSAALLALTLAWGLGMIDLVAPTG